MLLSQFLFTAAALLFSGARAEVYDYIVVGSGPGGGPLAANLAKAGHKTLLLEAGDDQSNNVNTTLLYNANAATNDEKTRWDFFVDHTDDEDRKARYKYTTWRKTDGKFYVGTQPPAGATRLGVWYPRTGTLGGCAMHNAGLSVLPQDSDWNHIAKITGDDTWLAKNMRQYYKKLEKNNYVQNSADHGYNGYLEQSQGDGAWANQQSDARMLGDIAASLTNSGGLSSAVRRDINANDPNRDNATGIFGLTQHATTQGRRSSPALYVKSVLNDAKKYPLTLQLNSLVTKILFDGNTATGVEFRQGQYLYAADPRHNPNNKGTLGQHFARKEVIIAGGVFNTPQILKLSGIGPKEELDKFGIPVISNLPGVGARMADNYEAGIVALANRNFQGFGGIYAVLLKSSVAKARDLFLWCGQFTFEGFWPGFPNNYGPTQYECAMAHLGPRSQEGVVKLRSANPQDVPYINLKLFEKNADTDLTAILEGIKWARNLLSRATGGLAPFKELHPCAAGEPCTDASQKDYLKTQVYSHHATSTAAIGGDDDPMAVLDSRFRVRGVKNLRVVDGSAFPEVPGAFPVLPTFMLAEKATEDILTGR